MSTKKTTWILLFFYIITSQFVTKAYVTTAIPDHAPSYCIQQQDDTYESKHECRKNSHQHVQPASFLEPSTQTTETIALPIQTPDYSTTKTSITFTSHHGPPHQHILHFHRYREHTILLI